MDLRHDKEGEGRTHNDYIRYGRTAGVHGMNLFYGASSILLIIILCFIGTCLQSRRRRRVNRENEQALMNRQLNEQARLDLRKGRAEKTILTLVSDSSRY